MYFLYIQAKRIVAKSLEKSIKLNARRPWRQLIADSDLGYKDGALRQLKAQRKKHGRKDCRCFAKQ